MIVSVQERSMLAKLDGNVREERLVGRRFATCSFRQARINATTREWIIRFLSQMFREAKKYYTVSRACDNLTYNEDRRIDQISIGNGVQA